MRSVDPSIGNPFPIKSLEGNVSFGSDIKGCATVEEMGEIFVGGFREENLRVRRMIQDHFALHAEKTNRSAQLRLMLLCASRVRDLPPVHFCSHGFVLGKASEAGFGNEMYKILTAAALSIMLNRSLIIGQTRHIGSFSSLSGQISFWGLHIYTDLAFTLREVKHLWRQNGCEEKYGRPLVVRIDNFEKPAQTNVLCSNWREWEQSIIWFQGTTDAVAAQFFLKNVHPEMRKAASDLFGSPEFLLSRANVYGELMRVLISPSDDVKAAVNWVLGGGGDPDISLHMRMLMNRSVRAVQAALNCIRQAMRNLHEGNISAEVNGVHNLDFRVKDWGPAPRWVAFVDFFLASRAKHAVVSGAHRRVGTTMLKENTSSSWNFSFFSSFQSNLLVEGLVTQVGWGHVWNRFAGPLSCHSQSNQCAHTPLLPPAWWDGLLQSPIPRDIRSSLSCTSLRIAFISHGIRIELLHSSDNGMCKNVADFPHFLDGVKTMEMTEVWKLAGIPHKIGYFYQDMEDDIWNT
ncbi:hypothetical protein CK203_067600 [Vitis vinifera]|uniref:Uncharacterized protein n=1 Tax=Vitis vinifera TaxID=29760 RepID=A0A438EBK4_VITVI|nr:hypothetical protein CK203_067600 [Vitis vinifera]